MPNSVAGVGTEPLRLFLNQINFGHAYTDQELQTSSVVLEEHIDNDRRVDIVIYVGKDVYPIEVKVDAEDQPAQLFDYYHYYKDETKYRIEKVFYLSPDGRSPSSESVRAKKNDRQEVLRTDTIQCLSFETDIKLWLNKLNAIDNKNGNYYFLLRQFEEVVNVMCAQQTNKNALYNAVGLDSEFRSDEEMKVLINILSMNQDGSLWEMIRDKYLQKCLVWGSLPYILTKEGLDGKHDVFSVKNTETGELVAWICVDWNLYIVSRRKVDWGKSASGYYWRYISPRGEQEFRLDKPNPSISSGDKIDISELLLQIETAQ